MTLISKKYLNIARLAIPHLIVVAGLMSTTAPCHAMEPEETNNDKPVVSYLPRIDCLDRDYINGDAIDISGWPSEFDNAHGLLGKLYQAEQKYEDAAQLFHGLALLGSRSAQYEFALMCKKGEGVEQNYEEANKWLLKAASQGHPSAEYQLGQMHKKGEGVPQNYTTAAKWYRLAAEQGHSYAQYEFGLLFSKKGLGVEPNDQEAAKWCQKAAEQGHIDAQYWFGLMHQHGKGVKRSQRKAIVWYSVAAEQGHIRAQKLLGDMILAVGGQVQKVLEELGTRDDGRSVGEQLADLGFVFEIQEKSQSDESSSDEYPEEI